MRGSGARTLTQGARKGDGTNRDGANRDGANRDGANRDGERQRDGPRTSEGAGPVNRWGELLAQTAAGSSSTRRLRVRLESSGMPGPIVVLMAAFLM
ncbi:hypothetical protein GTY49_08255 [Streptomyces sp. SID5477]|nr:hypothetical protein [Streptomyces sp. SID5477]